MSIPKIRNIKTSETQLGLQKKTNEIKSMKNRLLQNSDWVYLPDSNISAENLTEWKQWRDKVKEVNKITDFETAKKYLNGLLDEKPTTSYDGNIQPQSLSLEVPAKDISVDQYQLILQKKLTEVLEQKLETIKLKYGFREILVERFDEAERYLLGKKDNNFLLEAESKYRNKDMDSIVSEIVEKRKQYLIDIIAVNDTQQKYVAAIGAVATSSECDTIRDELDAIGATDGHRH